MERDRRAGGANNENEKKNTRDGASKHADQHDQPSVDVLEPKSMEEGRRARGASNKDKLEGARDGASFHVNQHS
jgi:hypothetical protein